MNLRVNAKVLSVLVIVQLPLTMATSKEHSQLSSSLNEFSWELYRSVGDDPARNIFFSPYSIMAALAMTYAGAKNNTAKQMSAVLKFGKVENVHQSFQKLNEALLSPNDLYKLRSANRLYAQKDFSFLDAFLETTQREYGASLFPVNFKAAAEEARSLINSWVNEQTDGKIQDLVEPGALNAATVLVLVNAVYFKGNWLDKFDPEATSVQEFKVSPTETIPVDMMYMEEKFAYFEDKNLKCQVLSLPYVDKRLRMTVVLPEQSMSLADLEAKINPDVAAAWGKACRKQKVALSLPRFKLETSFVLNDQLAQMGMTDLFDQSRADLSGITESNKLFMSKIIHKAFIEVNEEGTEAAAATAGIIMLSAVLDEPPSFTADHPFLFFISEGTSGAVLFTGRLVKPPKTSSQRDEL